MATLCLILGIMLLIGAIVTAYRPWVPSVILSYVAMWVLNYGKHIYIGSNTLLFWGIATMMVLLIRMGQQHDKPDSNGMGYIATGALVGCVVGMLMSHAGIILGSALGAAMGLMAYCRTPNGHTLRFPSKEWIMQLAAKGLPIIVSMSIIGTTLNELLTIVSIYLK